MNPHREYGACLDRLYLTSTDPEEQHFALELMCADPILTTDLDSVDISARLRAWKLATPASG